MKPIKKILLVLFCSLFTIMSAEDLAEPLRLSLKEVQDYALAHSTETLNASIDVQMAQKKTWETTAIGLPQISGKVSYTNMLMIPTTLIPAKFFDPNAADGEFMSVKFGTQHNASAELTVNQLIFNGSYIVGLQAAQVYQQLSKNQLEKRAIDIRETVANTYYLILLAEKNQGILMSTVENLRQNLYEVGELHKAGFTEATDVDQMQLSLTDLDTQLASTKRQTDMAYQMLKFQMGLDLERELELSQNLDQILADIVDPQGQNVEVDLSKHIDFRILATQEQAMALLLKREKSEFLPTIDAFLSYTNSAMRDQFNFFRKGDWFESAILGVNFSMPIFSSGQRLARVAQAKLELDKTKNLKTQVADGLKLALQQAKSDFTDAYAREKSTADNVVLAKRIYENNRQKFSKGMISAMDLTQVHNQYLGSESSHTQAVVALLNAKNKLEKALNRF